MKPVRLPGKKRLSVGIAILSLALLMLMAPRSHAAAGPARHPAGARTAARPFGMNERMYRLMLVQIPLDRAANRIQLAAARPGAGHRGLFNTEVNDAGHVLTVRWHGAVPADIARLIRRLRRTVRIRIVPAAFSVSRLEQAISRAKRIDPSVTGGYPLPDGGGVHLDVRGSRLRAAAATVRSRLGVPAVAAPSVTVKLQATCSFAPGDTLGPGSRCWDLPPGFWGGDVIQSQYAGCTGGFGVHDSSGKTYMMTAAHCAETSPGSYQNGVTFQNGNKTATLGQITDVPGPHDGALIPTSTGNRYYDGNGIYAGDTTNTKSVAGQQGVSVNDYLCESGAFGGVVCDMKVTATGYQPPGDPWDDLALASSLSGRYSISGDSGGPWFSLAGSSSVTAKGIHEGVTENSSGAPTGELFTPISVLSADMGVSVNS